MDFWLRKKRFLNSEHGIKNLCAFTSANRHTYHFLMRWESATYEPGGLPEDLHNESASSAVTMALLIKCELVLLLAGALSFMSWVQRSHFRRSPKQRYTKGIKAPDSSRLSAEVVSEKLSLCSIKPVTQHVPCLVCDSFLKIRTPSLALQPGSISFSDSVNQGQSLSGQNISIWIKSDTELQIWESRCSRRKALTKGIAQNCTVHVLYVYVNYAVVSHTAQNYLHFLE